MTVTVDELIKALSNLPSDTPVWEIGAGYEGEVSRDKWNPFYVYASRQKPETRLYIVSHNASYPQLEKYWSPLFGNE